MQVAGQTRWVAPVDGGMAQIYNDQGSRFSAPVTRVEAGLDEHGQPVFASRLATPATGGEFVARTKQGRHRAGSHIPIRKEATRMGEYATYQNERIKIGTCEDLTDLRADQWHLVAVELEGCDERTYLQQSRFRFPWPDEDTIEPGGFTEIDRSCLIRGAEVPEDIKDHHRTVQFKARGGYLCSLPCPESGTELDGVTIHRNGYQGAVHLCAQRWWNGLLVGVLRCNACGAKWRLETLAEAEPAAVVLRSEADRLGASQAGWYHTVADRLLAGYRTAGIDTGSATSDGGGKE